MALNSKKIGREAKNSLRIRIKLCSVWEQGAVDLGQRATFSVQRFRLLVDVP